MLACAELFAFERLAADATMAPVLADRAALARMAAAECDHMERLRARLGDLGCDADQAMAPFVATFEAFHALTVPSDWLEGLVKAYVGDGLAADFYREIAASVDADTRDLVLEVCADLGHAAFAEDRVRAAVAADPRVGARLALWGRRLVGEALAQAQAVAAEHDALAGLLVKGADLAELSAMFTRLTTAHARRMTALGLAG